MRSRPPCPTDARLCLAFVVLCAGHTAAVAQIPSRTDCPQARALYARRNDHLLLNKQSRGDETGSTLRSRTADLLTFVTRLIQARLSDTTSPSAIRTYLTCMQNTDDERPWPDATNTPQVYLRPSGPAPLAFSVLQIMRGGGVLPDTLALAQCYTQVSGRWRLVPNRQSQQSFDGHSLFVHPLQSPDPHELWFLLSGRSLGDTGGRLRLEVVSCSRTQMRTVWQSDGIIWGDVHLIDQSTVSLTYLQQEDEQKALRNGDTLGPEDIITDGTAAAAPKVFTKLLHVTPNGLEP